MSLLLQALYLYFVLAPVHWLYTQGPSSLGFWEGKPHSAICARETHIGSQEYWESTHDSQNECKIFIDRKVNSYATVFVFVAYLCMFFFVIFTVIECSKALVMWMFGLPHGVPEKPLPARDLVLRQEVHRPEVFYNNHATEGGVLMQPDKHIHHIVDTIAELEDGD